MLHPLSFLSSVRNMCLHPFRVTVDLSDLSLHNFYTIIHHTTPAVASAEQHASLVVRQCFTPSTSILPLGIFFFIHLGLQ